MGTTYEYTYEYEITDPTKGARNTGGTTQRSVAHSHPGGIIAHSSRSDMVDPLANLQHDRIWTKLYDPVSMDKAQHDIEIQKMARRQDRKIIKIEAAHGSDRQTFIVKRDYELRVRDVMEEASRTFKIPADQVILYWKGRNICETPDVLLESLGVENNNTMRVARADEQYFARHQQQGRYQQAAASSGGMYGQQQQQQQQQSGAVGYYGSQGGSYSSGYSGQQYGAGGAGYGQQTLSSSATSGGAYGQQSESYGGQQQYYPSQTYYSSSTGYDQNYGNYGNRCNCTCHQDQHQDQHQHQHHNCKCCCHCHGSTNHYQQFNSPVTARSAASTPAVATYITSLQIGLGDRVQGLAIGRQHPITIYDLQVELQQHFNIPILEQNISFNGMPLLHLPPDTSLETIGIFSNSFISLWPKSTITMNQQQFTPRQQASSSSASSSSSSYYYANGSQPLYGDDMSSRRMYYSNSGGEMMQTGNQEDVMKLEVFHGTDRHVMILRSSNNIRIIDLMEELQNITTVPVQNQKLYYRGQELQTMKERTLRDVGLDNNSQVRLIGDPLKSRYAPIITGNQTN